MKQHLLVKNNNLLFINTMETEKCKTCLSDSKATFENSPFCMFFEIFDEENQLVNISSIQLSFNICNCNYNFLCATIYNSESVYYKAIFRLNKSFYLIDDFTNSIDTKVLNCYNIKTLYYYLA